MNTQFCATDIPFTYESTPYQQSDKKLTSDELTYVYYEFSDTSTGLKITHKICLQTDANAICNAGKKDTWLHVAAVAEHEFMLKGFITLGKNSINLEVRNNEDYTPLMAAIEAQKEKSIEILLDTGADIHAVSKNCGSALHLAATTNLRIMQLIFQKKKDSLNLELEHVRETPLYSAIRAKCTDIAEMLINANVHIHNEDGRSPLTTAAFNGNTKIVQMLLTRGAKICSCSLSVGYYTKGIYSRREVRTLKDASPLFGALNNGANEEIIQNLIEAGDDPHRVLSDGSNILYWAVRCEENSSKVLEYLLKLGVNPNQRCLFDGLTPLLNTESFDHIALLLKYKADPNVSNREGSTALSSHCRGFRTDDANTIEVLLNHGATPNDENFSIFVSNHTSPHLVIHAFKLTKLFLAKGAKITNKIKQEFDQSFLVKENAEFKALIEQNYKSECIVM